MGESTNYTWYATLQNPHSCSERCTTEDIPRLAIWLLMARALSGRYLTRVQFNDRGAHELGEALLEAGLR